ncbi:MAG: hypothetical protein E6J42_05600 [Chloroflexi bacterium]|nr:MAG: hypothetical protein E6J42_05600 [Chloroflexota bacterium]
MNCGVAILEKVSVTTSGRRFRPTGRWSPVTFCVALCFLLGSPPVHSVTFTTFDAAGAGTGPNQGTFPQSINEGAITGYFVDGNNVAHGFLRDPDGTITTFDAAGAGTGFGQGTVPTSINPNGAISGYYVSAFTLPPPSNLNHGFLRDPDGTITSFDPPGSEGTFPASANGINPAGAITGYYNDRKGVAHGFLRAPDGTITSFDAPFAHTDFFGEGTFPAANNPEGAITGYYVGRDNDHRHGFLRAPDGTITSFRVPNPSGEAFNTEATSINPKGEITGLYHEFRTRTPHGFVRARDGMITTFDAPGAGTGFDKGTYPDTNNPMGTITGFYYDAGRMGHGFVRARDGTITSFDVPGASGTAAFSINPEGTITGIYKDANQVIHGFLRSPDEDVQGPETDDETKFEIIDLDQ